MLWENFIDTYFYYDAWLCIISGLLANYQERNDLTNDQHLVTAAVVVCAINDCALWPACEEKKFLICYFLSYGTAFIFSSLLCLTMIEIFLFFFKEMIFSDDLK